MSASAERDPGLFNQDLAPVPLGRRTWGLYSYASLWVAMSVCIPTYMLASGLIAGGMSWWQAVGTILLGNLIVLAPMLLNAHAGAKYGIPFPVFVRASFGVRGANLPALLRALVACGWFGIQTWIGGQAIHSMLQILWPAASNPSVVWFCFGAFWLLNMAVVWKGIETIRFLEGVGAPFMLGVGLLLLLWITGKAGGFGPVLSTPSKFHSVGDFMEFFVPSLTAMVGFWATVALNIPDFTRYAKSQRAQMLGQALGLPPAMTLYSFIGVAVTSASVVIFGEAIWDPVALIGRFHQPLVAFVGADRDSHRDLEHECGGERGIAIERFLQPESAPDLVPHWRHDHGRGGRPDDAVETDGRLQFLHIRMAGRVFGFARAGGRHNDRRLFHCPPAGVECATIFTGAAANTSIRSGINPKALVSLGLGVAVALVGLAAPSLRFLYDYAWFVGFGVSAASYLALTGRQAPLTAGGIGRLAHDGETGD